MPLAHHDLCFGCGQANVFGLGLELEREDAERVRGRFFVKQDHQGPPGFAHGGIIAAALDEAMALILWGEDEPRLTGRLEVDFRAPAAVGSFVAVEASVERREGGKAWTRASAVREEDGVLVAEGRSLLVPAGPAA